MSKAAALAKWAEVYGKVLESAGAKPYCTKTAIEYGVLDMINQTKNMSEDDAAYMINDDAEWMMEKL